MNPILMPVLTALALRCIAVMELLARLRWQKHQRRARFYCVVTLPRGCRLDDIRVDGDELHLVIVHLAELTER